MPGLWAALYTHHALPTPLTSTLGFPGIRKLSFLLQSGHLSWNQAGKEDSQVRGFPHKVRDGTA